MKNKNTQIIVMANPMGSYPYAADADYGIRKGVFNLMN